VGPPGGGERPHVTSNQSIIHLESGQNFTREQARDERGKGARERGNGVKGKIRSPLYESECKKAMDT